MSRPALNPSVFRALGAAIAVLLAVVVAVLAAPTNRMLASGVVLLVAAGSLAIGVTRAKRAGLRYQRLPPDVDGLPVQPESDPPHALEGLGRVVNREVEELRASQDVITRRILDATHDAVVIADEHGIIVDWNRSAEIIFGWPRAEAVGRTVVETLVPEELYAEHLAGVRQLLAGEGGFLAQPRVEVRARRRDGSRFPAELTVAPVRTGDAVAYVGFIRDITDRFQVERALRASEERFRRLIETAHVVPWEASSHTTRVTYVGPQAEALLGFPLEDWYAEGFWINRVHADDREYALTQLATAAGSETACEFEYRMLHQDGHVVWVRDIVVADVTGEGPVLRGFRFDITERRRLEEELLQSQKMEAVGRLAGGIAHDFNNILTAILGYTAMLETGLSDQPALRSDVIEIRRAAGQAADLTQQLLAFARKQVIRPRVIVVDEMLLRLEKMVVRLIGEDVQVVLVTDAEGAAVRVDPGRLEQALVNLVFNARDAMVRGGTLTLRTEVCEVDAAQSASEGVRAGSYVMVAVSDTGVGMDRQTLAHAFEPFFTTKKDGKGTGLGLATAHGVIAQAGGFIQVETEPKRGSTFKVFLPLVREAATGLDVPAPPPPVMRGNETILLAEDEPQVRKLTERALLRGGYRVLIAQNGQEAVEQSRAFEGPIHLLVTDVVMPVMGGVRAADLIRSERPETKVLFVSGYSEEALFREGVDEGVHFLNKPFTPSDLDRKVREVLDGVENSAKV